MSSKTDQEVLRRMVGDIGFRGTELSQRTGIRRARLSDWKNGKLDLRADELLVIGDQINSRLTELSESGHFKKKASSAAERGAVIRRLRLKYSISQEALGRKAGVPQFEISMFETGADDAISSEKITRLEEALTDLMADRKAELAKGKVQLKSLLSGSAEDLRRAFATHMAENGAPHPSIYPDVALVADNARLRSEVNSLQERIRIQDDLIANLKEVDQINNKLIAEYKARVEELEPRSRGKR